MAINNFGAKIVPGKNLHFLNNIQAFYKRKKGVNIVGYHIAKACDKKRNITAILNAEGVLPRCNVCRCDLYVLEPDQDESGEVFVKQKIHLILTDDTGKKYLTCKGISLCMRKAGWSQSWKEQEDTISVINAPLMTDFMSVTRPNSDPDSDIEIERVKQMEPIYNKIVVPFLEKWNKQSVSKQNLTEFMQDLKRLDEFSNYLFDERVEVFMNKVFNFIGVT